MKKFMTIVLAMSLVAMFAVDAQAKWKQKHRNKIRKGRGAVKAVLQELQEGDDPTGLGSGDAAGFVVLNTNDEGVLIVNVKVKRGAADAAFDVTVTIDGIPTIAGQLATNKKGKGAAHFKLDVSGAYPGESIEVQVAVLPAEAGETLGYTTAAQTVPLKPLAEPV